MALRYLRAKSSPLTTWPTECRASDMYLPRYLGISPRGMQDSKLPWKGLYNNLLSVE